MWIKVWIAEWVWGKAKKHFPRFYSEKNGAGEETRTLDSHLGKVALYQLSYTRSRKSGRTIYRNKGGLQTCFSGFFQRIAPHEVGEHAVVADGVGMVAKIGLHLQQPLLQCRTPQRDAPPGKQPLPHELEP